MAKTTKKATAKKTDDAAGEPKPAATKKAPAKAAATKAPAAATGSKKAAPRKASAAVGSPAAQQTGGPSQDEISARAHQLWIEKGRPMGQDEAIWHEAVRQLTGGGE